MRKTAGLTATILFITAAPLAAQAWDAPSFLPPVPGDDLGAYFVDPEGGDWGLVAIWRQSGNVNLGVRAGVLDAVDGVGFVVGGEAYDVLLGRDQGLPVDAAWTLGFGAAIGETTLLRVPLGASVGRAFEGENWTLVPYVHPRVALEVAAIDDESETDLAFTTDIGADLMLGDRWIVRGGVSLFDRDAIGIGVAYHMARGVEVSSR